jgi:CTD small phosphatase-like protein 2
VLLDAIDKGKNYFDYRLYRQHAVLDKNDFVKDLSKLGRDVRRMIIIDNMPQNFRLQKENGIYIKTYWGDDNKDTALLDLIPILINMAKTKTNDIRKTLRDHHEEILKKISSNLNKNK